MRHSLRLAAGAVCITLGLQAATEPQELLSKARKALGGDQKLAAVKSLVATGTYRRNVNGAAKTEEAMVMTGSAEMSLLLPDKFMRTEEMESPMGGAGPTRIESLDGETSWTDVKSPAGSNIIMRVMNGPGADAARQKNLKGLFARTIVALMLTPPPSAELEWTYAGEAEASDGKADVLDGKNASGFAVRLFLDQETHMPLMLGYRAEAPPMMVQRTAGSPDGASDDKVKQMHGDAQTIRAGTNLVDYQLRLSEYRKVGGIQLPHQFTLTSAGATVEELEIKKYVVNASIDPDKFRKK